MDPLTSSQVAEALYTSEPNDGSKLHEIERILVSLLWSDEAIYQLCSLLATHVKYPEKIDSFLNVQINSLLFIECILSNITVEFSDAHICCILELLNTVIPSREPKVLGLTEGVLNRLLSFISFSAIIVDQEAPIALRCIEVDQQYLECGLMIIGAILRTGVHFLSPYFSATVKALLSVYIRNLALNDFQILDDISTVLHHLDENFNYIELYSHLNSLLIAIKKTFLAKDYQRSAHLMAVLFQNSEHVEFIQNNIDEIAEICLSEHISGHFFVSLLKRDNITRKTIFKIKILPRWIQRITRQEAQGLSFDSILETLAHARGLEPHLDTILKCLQKGMSLSVDTVCKCLSIVVRKYGALYHDHYGVFLEKILTLDSRPTEAVLRCLFDTSQFAGRKFHLLVQEFLYNIVDDDAIVGPWREAAPQIIVEFNFDPALNIINSFTISRISSKALGQLLSVEIVAVLKSIVNALQIGALLSKCHELLNSIVQISFSSAANSSLRSTIIDFLCEHAQLDVLMVRCADGLVALNVIKAEAPIELQAKIIKILSRLALLSPAVVLPYVRLDVARAVVEISEFSDISTQLRGAVFFSLLPLFPKDMVQPFTHSVMETILSRWRLKTIESSELNIFLMESIDKLVSVDPNGVEPYLAEAFKVLFSFLQEYVHPAKKLASLSALISICRFGKRSFLTVSILASIWHFSSEFLKVESEPNVRRMIITVMGVIGAIDPYIMRSAEIEKASKLVIGPNSSSPSDTKVSNSFSADAHYSFNEIDEEKLFEDAAVSGNFDETFSGVAMHAILKIIRDPSLSHLHLDAASAATRLICKIDSFPSKLLPRIFEALLGLLKSKTWDRQSFALLLRRFTCVVYTLRTTCREFAHEVVDFISHLSWIDVDFTSSFDFVQAILSFLLSVAYSLRAEMPSRRLFLSKIIDIIRMIDASYLQKTDVLQMSQAIFSLLTILAPVLSEYGQDLLPPVIALAEKLDDIRSEGAGLSFGMAVFLRAFAEHVDLTLYMPALTPLLLRLSLLNANASVHVDYLFAQFSRRPEAVECSYGRAKSFDEVVNEFCNNARFSCVEDLDVAVSSTLNLEEWNNEGLFTKDDWVIWIRRLSESLIVHSPDPSLASLGELAKRHYLLSKRLFNIAFLSFFEALPAESQSLITSSLEFALSSPVVPPEIAQQILCLAEFLEHQEKPLPIDMSILGSYAYRCHAYAKALYYNETEFRFNPSIAITESLISINHQMQQSDAAIGLLMHAQKIAGFELQEGWYEKLNRWDDALAEYTRKYTADPSSTESLLGIFRCQNALGHWHSLTDHAFSIWNSIGDSVKAAIAPLAASSAWATLKWDRMELFTSVLNPETLDGSFFRAVLAVRNGNATEALRLKQSTYPLIDTELSALLGESYSRAYRAIVRVQNIVELEEALFYLRSHQNDPIRERIESLWTSRLSLTQQSVEVWQRILKLRALAISPRTSSEVTIRFAKICQKTKRMDLAKDCFVYLLGIPSPEDIDSIDVSGVDPFIVYANAKYLWNCNASQKAIDLVRKLIKFLTGYHASDPKSSQLLSKCHRALAMWLRTLAHDVDSTILDHFIAASSYDPSSYKAWHGLATANQDMIEIFERKRDMEARPRSNPFIVPSIQSFFKSIALANDGNALQDILRLLTLWFKYGHIHEVNAAINDGFYSIPVENWLKIIPQLIARIHVPNPQVRRLIHHVLTDIGRRHPHALIMPITVAVKSPSMSRKTAALALLDRFRMHSPSLIDQAILVSQELIRLSILWEEMWHEGLEEASRFFFGEHDVNGMLSVLEPLHHMINKGAETAHERHFLESYGAALQQAHDFSMRYKRSGDSKDITKAWELYYAVSKKISKHLPNLNTLMMESVAPKLTKCRDLDLSVPGLFNASGPIITISLFRHQIFVINSKQRPRKIDILGSDGKSYRFLLKGHEDLRQDQRVMQLFGLVNFLLDADQETSKRHLGIQTFSIVPLSQNTGLISWIPHCDTLHALIKEFRDSRGISISAEHRIMLQFAPDFDKLPLLQKVEAFSYAMSKTDGRDLSKLMWQKSQSSEAWFERRLAFIRSLAVMSMVGYVLGLGDRHPSNLMIDQVSGKVVHIDFGDCFEVAMHRDRYPEMVPFRLTRMLISAFEVSGVEGSFRITCEHTIRVLRQNKDSVMAVLEAFIYDPLINWRLLTKPNALPNKTATQKGGTDDFSDKTFPANFLSSRRFRKDEEVAQWEEESVNRPEATNAGALNVVDRVANKLTGRELKSTAMTVNEQVDFLIKEATSVENLCQAYIGWCPFW